MTVLSKIMEGMSAKHVLRLFAFVLCALSLSACGMQQVRVADVMHNLDAGVSPKQALAQLNKHVPSKDSKDRVHYLLNAAVLMQLSGDVRGSADMLNEAKKRIKTLDAVSPTELIGSVTLNDTVRSYVPSPAERVLIHAVQIQNYLALGELDSARVEVLQADQLMRDYRNDKNVNAQLASVYYLMGVVFELSGELDDALIAYRRAKTQMGDVIPNALQQALMTTAYHTGNREEFTEYVNTFHPKTKDLDAIKARQGWATILGMYWQGRSVEKVSSDMAIFSEELGQSISLSLPSYAAFKFDSVESPTPYDLASSQSERDWVMARYLDWHQIESVNHRLEADLSAQMAGITARMVARAVARHHAKKELIKQHGQEFHSGLLMLEFFSLFLETADTRGWSALPANILISRARVPVEGASVQLPVAQDWQSQPVSLSANQYYVLYKNDLAGVKWMGRVFP